MGRRKHLVLPKWERLNEAFEVVPVRRVGLDSGLIWKNPRSTRMKPGDVVGTIKSSKVSPDRFDWQVQLDGKLYRVSRIIYKMMTFIDSGDYQIDHINENSLDNNIVNLRIAFHKCEIASRSKLLNNTSGAIGVSKWGTKWQAQMKTNNRRTYLGVYTCKLKAADAYNQAIIKEGLLKYGKPLNDLTTLSCDCAECRS